MGTTADTSSVGIISPQAPLQQDQGPHRRYVNIKKMHGHAAYHTTLRKTGLKKKKDGGYKGWEIPCPRMVFS